MFGAELGLMIVYRLLALFVAGHDGRGGVAAGARLASASFFCRAGVRAVHPARGAGCEVTPAKRGRRRGRCSAAALFPSRRWRWRAPPGGCSGPCVRPEPIVRRPPASPAERMLERDRAEPYRRSRRYAGVRSLPATKPGGTMLILGGTHPQEIGGMAGRGGWLIENVSRQAGPADRGAAGQPQRLSPIPNPMEAYLHSFTIDTPGRAAAGFRRRHAPDQSGPTSGPIRNAFVHSPSRERGWSAIEARNLNRKPPRAVGRLAHGAGQPTPLTALAKQSSLVPRPARKPSRNIPVINMMVRPRTRLRDPAGPPRSRRCRRGRIPISLEAPRRRIFTGSAIANSGDHTSAEAVLTESANPRYGAAFGRAAPARDLVGGGGATPIMSGAAQAQAPLRRAFDEQGWPAEAAGGAKTWAAIEELDQRL